MKTWKIDQYKITFKETKHNSNYNKFVALYENDELVSMESVRNDTTDLQAVAKGVELIKSWENFQLNPENFLVSE